MANLVQRLLATFSDEDQMGEFHVEVFMFANPIEQRGLTVFYTVFAENLPVFIATAEKLAVTVQIRSDNPPPYWPVKIKGSADPWVHPTDS